MGTNLVSCYIRANEAYRATMPPLSNDKNVKDFIRLHRLRHDDRPGRYPARPQASVCRPGGHQHVP
jgi:hypothetical protein